MKIPLSWLKEFVSIPVKATAEDIAQAFVNVGFEVEEIEYQGKDLKGPLLVGKVLSIEELSGHKKPIRFVGLDLGSGKSRFVICGARNFKVNDLVVVAIPGAVLPGNFVITARETYGKISDGMICSAKELGISEEHAGIIVLPDGKVGSDAIKLLEIEDVIFDVAINPDRGYAMSVRGLARELAASLNCKYIDPANRVALKKLKAIKSSKAITVKIEDKTGADQIFIRTLDQVNTKIPTPIWMQRRLEKCGMRSISLAVDITNYVMLELGQPLHASDAETFLETTKAMSCTAAGIFQIFGAALSFASGNSLRITAKAQVLLGRLSFVITLGCNSPACATTFPATLNSAHRPGCQGARSVLAISYLFPVAAIISEA